MVSNDPHGSTSATAGKVKGELETTRQKIILTRCSTIRLGASSVAAEKVRSELETRQIIILTRCPTTRIGSSYTATAGKVRSEFETTKQIIILKRCPPTHMWPSSVSGKVRSELETRQIIILTRCPTTHTGASAAAAAAAAAAGNV